MKRLLALLLTLALLPVAFSAFADAEFVDGKFTEPVKLTVEVYNRYNDGGTDPTSSVYAQYIHDGMLAKYNIDVEFVSIGRWSEVDDIGNLLAAGSAPDVCVTYSYPTILTYADMGGIVDLSGRTVHTSTLQTAGQIVYSINTSRLASGIYNVVFSNGSQKVVRKLVVK